MYTCHPGTQEVEEGGPGVQGQAGLERDPVSERRECRVPGPARCQPPPGDCTMRSGADVLLQVHAYIISYLKKEMPSVFGKENKKKQLIFKLPVIFAKIQLEHHISPGDFPDCQKMQVGGTPDWEAGCWREFPGGPENGAWKAVWHFHSGEPGFMS